MAKYENLNEKPAVGYRRAYYLAHKDKALQCARAYYLKNRDKVIARLRERRRLGLTPSRHMSKEYNRLYNFRRHGLTETDFNSMLIKQNNQCAICSINILGQYKSKRKAHIDHNHITGKTRGLLCHHCNADLAIVENKKFVANAIAYLSIYE